MIESRVTLNTEVSKDGVLTITISGRLDSTSTGNIWQGVIDALERASSKRVVVDTSEIDYCDGTGIGLLVEIQRRQKKTGSKLEISGLRDEYQKLLDFFDPLEFEESRPEKSRKTNLTEEVGRATFSVWDNIRSQVAFLGELVAALYLAARNPTVVRWKDAFLIAETAGVNAFPIVALISFLIGLIMAFQAAIPMKQFGAEIFVADLIALSTLRELGPLMTAIVMAGRTSSAFAAELGTMKVNEEVDALTTMGLDPVRFLVLTRVIATLFMMPLITIFANLFGILGGSVVLLSMGYPLNTYIDRIIQSADYVDLLGGLLKSLAFGLIVAGIGCSHGLRTRTGASAVGDSTTKAVVSGIIMIILTDGLFSVVYFYLGI
ncbi:MAG: MlaE family lipid ABC transporter permease subunit [Candidatus Scalindua sp.]|jgi:phospholipid/cholesterol/gamma-HCH transport system permease protein|nr:MlaE family lipid ABC transporter permease subunit [Candidatus Scalindua sp.]MBT5305298.1 MlaE family lipid ABC transporter permease subunit [Candidatus Scalindua sp.]MBT6226704.1 MlaE family lipid ABC transporter permease subunit [Candidatus Scalindua sp.]MBT6563571.1 MlaE family lipid ABC transporter permease subunit [Candidatus Scalindua sp.]MBT7211086.1 MlaE family lipid ABC transporter permease subunit [Candidatus Scalindua sp.]